MDTEINEIYTLLSDVNAIHNELTEQINIITYMLNINSEYIENINREYGLLLIKLVDKYCDKN